MAKKTKKEVVTDTEHSKLCDYVTEAEDNTSDARDISEKCRDYYDSNQLTAKEISALNKRKQAPVVINRIKPKIDALMGMEKGAKTTAKAYPRTPKHEKAAEAGTESIRFVLQDNAFDQIRSMCWEHILVEGTGGGEIIVKKAKRASDGLRVTINPIMWDRIIYDPHSRRKDFSDARYLGQVVWMDYDDAVDLYPDAKDVLENMQAGSQTYADKPRWMDGKNRVKIVELYYKKVGEVWYACFTRGGYCEKPKMSPYKNEEGETEWPYEYASAFVDREGGRYGAVKQLLDVQDEINKRRSKALHLMSVRQTFGTSGAVTDVNKARQELAKPDGHLEVGFGEFGKDFGVLPTGDMAQAQFHLLEEAKSEIDSVGANAAMSGKDKTAVSGRALLARQNAGQTEIGPMFDVLRYWQYRVFRKVWNRIRQYWKEEKWIRVTDDNQNLRWVGLNKPITKGEQILEQAKQQLGENPQAAQLLAQLEQKIASDPLMKEVVDTSNDIASLDVDIILSEVPDVLTSQIEDFQVLGEMVKSGFQMPPLAVIEASPLSNKDKIIQMMKEKPQIPPELEKQMKDTQEKAQQLAEENQQLKAGAQTDAIKLQNQQKIKEDEHLLAKQVAKDEADRAREKAQLDAETKIICAEISAKSDTDIAIKQAEHTAALELNKQLVGSGASQEEGAPVESPMDKIMQSHQQVMQAHGMSQDTMKQYFEGMGSFLQQLVTLQQQTLQTQQEMLRIQKAPKKVSVGSIQKDPTGNITGASISTNTIQ